MTGLLNGMLGQSILIIPLVGLEAGIIPIVFLPILFSLITGYTAGLIVAHVGKAEHITQAILDHFKQDNKYGVIYNIVISSSFWSYTSVLFKLFIFQVQGLTEWMV